MIPSAALANILVANGFVFGGTDPWGVWIGRMPVGIHEAVVLFDSGGYPANPRWLIDYPTVQIKIRGTANDYQYARTKAILVKNILIGLPSQDVGDDRLVSVTMPGDISFLGYDAQNRPEFVLNLNLIIEPAATPESHRDPL